MENDQSQLPKRRIHMSDIAQRAGVALSSVSRVLNNNGSVSPALEQKVLQAARELGYPLVHRSHLTRLKRVMVFSLAKPESVEPFYSDLLGGIEDGCEEIGASLEYMITEPSEEASQFILQKVNRNQVDGIIAVAVDDTEWLAELLHHGVPLVLLNGLQPALAIDTIIPDNFMGGLQAMAHLFAYGHRRIAHATELHRETVKQRHLAYQHALNSQNIEYDPTIVLDMPVMDIEQNYEALREFINRHPVDYSAVFCGSDATAIAAMRAYLEAGYRVPEDISIIGFNDMPVASFITPQLTTIRIERVELGKLAVQQLAARVDDPARSFQKIAVATRLIQRQSVGQASVE